jgi:hypothetical protein
VLLAASREHRCAAWSVSVLLDWRGVARPCGAWFTDGGAGTNLSDGPRVHRCRMPFRLSTRRRGWSDGHLLWSPRVFKADRSAGAQAKAARLLALFG